jgi:hypothetical protein
MTVSQAALQARGRSTILHQSNMPVFGAQAPGQQENSRIALDHRGTNSTAAVRFRRGAMSVGPAVPRSLIRPIANCSSASSWARPLATVVQYDLQSA